MDYDRFIAVVERSSGLEGDVTIRAVRASLRTLAERLSVGEARRLAEKLPPELGPFLFTDTPAASFDVDEFVQRVADEADIDVPRATRAARGVFMALSRALGDREFGHVVAQLPKDFSLILPVGPEILPARAFIDRVAVRAGLDRDDAWRATSAVLRTLAERIAPGEVDDLISRLPTPMHEPLRQGRGDVAGHTPRMDVQEFLDRIARREDVSGEEAFAHARAVLLTLREAVGTEFFDVTVQLGPAYAPLWAKT
jgi:uncharacterized protein (DUF2267 family)